MAAAQGHLDAVDLLLGHEDADPSYMDHQAIRKAEENGHAEVVRRLMQGQRDARQAGDR